MHNKILPLDDHLIVYPNHGAGSACGKMMSKETTDTLGHQKETNYALQPMDKEEFIEQLLIGLTPPPGYFPKNVLMNIQGYESIDSVMEKAKVPLSPEAFEAAANETGALVLDTRNAEEFAQGFIPNSINIGLDGNFAMWVGEMIPDIKQKILLVCDEGKEEEAMIRLSRVGYDHTIGYLGRGFNSWKYAHKEIDKISRMDAKVLAGIMEASPLIFDVRKKSEFDSAHVIGAQNIPLNQINSHLAELPKDKAFIIHCAGGYRSMLAASILKARGWDNFIEVRDGFTGIKETDIPVSEYVCPTTLL